MLTDRFPYIWCDCCKSVQPLKIDVMEPGTLCLYAAADLLCLTCTSIIATLHENNRPQSNG